jgi:hypothetical protein
MKTQLTIAGLLFSLVGLVATSYGTFQWNLALAKRQNTSIFLTNPTGADLFVSPASLSWVGIGTAIHVFGLGFLALSKRRSIVWALCGVFYIIGFILVVILPSKDES